MTKTEHIRKLSEDNPSLTNRQIADILGCSRRHVRRVRNNRQSNMARILLFDIETAPIEAYIWKLWQNVVTPAMVKKDRSILSWSAKWLFESKLLGDVVTTDEAFHRKDESILDELWTLLDEADIVVAHNGTQFDTKFVNARFAIAGYPPPMSYRVVDTLRLAKRVFNLSSYSLDDINKVFGLNTKLGHEGIGLWDRCVSHDPVALEEMFKYNKRDVIILEELYLKIRPWIKGHPNIALYIDTDQAVCTNCGNEILTWGGYYYTPAGKYESFRCNNCGAIGRSRRSDLDKETKERMLLSVAS